jgi:signal transduction histidine kinase
VTEPLRVLIVEDAEDDALLLVRELRRGGYAVVFERVETEEQMTAALDRQPWDLVLADYALPRFSGPRALALVKGRGLDLPFIIVSGTIGEETAVAAMKAGAHDYLMKGHLARLVPAIQREVGDAEERRQRIAMEQVARRAEKLAALGTLAAGLAHELNNPMTAITGYLAILRKGVPSGSAQEEMIDRAQEQAGRVSRIVADLRRFAEQERHASGQRFSLGRAVDQALSLYGDRLRAAGITVTRNVDEPLPEAEGDPVQIQQMVAHLVENAINAMEHGGRLDVQLGTVDGDALRLRIADTGAGIPKPIRDRIFDPFFTTKEQAGRAGLGLSVSHSIVEAHHGRIVVESEGGMGAAFTVLLPAAATVHLA